MPWRNLQHIAARTLNQPLLMEPAYARVFFSALSERLGAERLIDGMTGQAFASEEMKALALDWSEEGGRRYKSYRIENGVAVLPVTGTLVHKLGYLMPVSGMTGYDGIINRLQAAVADPDVKGILLDIDSPGGEVAGAFDTSDIIARLRDVKPIWSLANDMACSAGYLLASACSNRLITQTGVVGSVGVVVAHRSVEKMLETVGVDITLIYSGAHKVDGNPYEKLPEDVRAEIQAKIDDNRLLFAGKVAEYTGLKPKAVMATEAATYEGADAVKIGFANQIVNYADAVSVMADAMKNKGVFMAGNTTTAASSALPAGADAATLPATADAATLPTVTATALTTAAAAPDELTRAMSILDCDEAKGREPLAKALARMPGMSLESAKAALLASPQSAQVRTDTALDQLMNEESPNAVDAGGAQTTGAATKTSGLLKAAKAMTGAE
ncbi:S49 family peptidase [Citrobacter sp. S2-9]|uniref:S49 family peptidase n=1 Tax=Citrobacter enshiensis TaxID=2971264 RepID=A0ABT8PRZ0_9ENTR|nr:S49 family peptidase [Citrobacter enshiensis]MDN8599023.1 S49 family peptidase [Citrobacter enshiensis]